MTDTPFISFSEAIAVCTNDGQRIARRSWSENLFVVLMPDLKLPPYNTQGTDRKVNDRTAKWIGEDKPLDCRAYFAVYKTENRWQPGWVPATDDMLATDWYVVVDAAQ